MITKTFHRSFRVSNLRYLYLLIIPVFIIQISPRAFGLSTTQKNLFNSGVYYFDSAASCSTALTGEDNQEKAFNYFIAKGLTGEQSAAIIGNLMQESGINPTSVQSPGEGRGIAQWNQPKDQPEGSGGRWGNLHKFASSLSLDPLELSTQLDFMWYELTGHYKNGYNKFISVTASYSGSASFSGDVNDAIAKELPGGVLTQEQLLTAAWSTVVFEEEYEKAGTPNMARRISLAYATLKDLNGSVASTQQASVGTGCSNDCDISDSASLADLSAIRQNVVCIAQQERDAWTPPTNALTTKRFLTYTGNLDQEWCAYFASWVYKQAGRPIQTDNQGRVAAVRDLKGIGENNSNGFYYYPADSYIPRPGDLAIQLATAESISHVLIVTGVTATTITLTSGNNSNDDNFSSLVLEYTLKIDNGVYNPKNIIGYVSPDAK